MSVFLSALTQRGNQVNSAHTSSSLLNSAGNVQKPPVTLVSTTVELGEAFYSLYSGIATFMSVAGFVIAGLIIFLYYFGDCIGVALVPVYVVAQKLTKALDNYDQLLLAADPAFGSTFIQRLENWFAAFFAFCVMFIPRLFEFTIGFVIAEAKDFWIQAIFLGLSAIFLAFQMQLAALTGFIVSGSSLATSAWNTGGAVFNTALDVSNAMTPIYNTNAGQTALFYSELSQLVQAIYNVPTGSGRRRLQVKAGGTAMDETFNALTTIANTLAVPLEALGTASRLTQLVIVAIALVSFVIIAAVLPGIGQNGMCALLSFECILKEALVLFLNVFVPIVKAFASAFGGAINFDPSSLACQSGDFPAGISTTCSSANGGPYTNLPAGASTGYTCQETSSGYSQYFNQGSSAQATTSGTNPTTACPNVRRALTAVGALLNSHESVRAGGTRCFFVDLPSNGTRWEVCPSSSLWEAPHVVWTLQTDIGHGRRLGSAKSAREHLAESLNTPVGADVRVRTSATKKQDRKAETESTFPEVIAELERAAAAKMQTTELTFGTWAVKCAEMNIEPGKIYLKSWTSAAISVACVWAALGSGDITESVRANVDAQIRLAFSKKEPAAHGRSLMQGADDSRVTDIVMRKLLDWRARYELAHAASHTSGRSLIEEVANDSPLARAVEESARRFQRLAQKNEKRRRLSTESASPTSAPTRPVGKCNTGVFCTPSICGSSSKECPGFPNQCFAPSYACPYPTGAPYTAIAQWGIQYANNSMSTFDVRSALLDVVNCPQQWEQNPDTNPAAHLGDDSNPGVICYPQVRPWPFGYVEESDFSLQPYLEDFCGSTDDSPCDCGSYLYGLENADAETLAGVATAMVIIAFNGILAFWTLLTTIFWFVFTGVNIIWSSFFGAFSTNSPGLVYFWTTQGQAGTTTHRIVCALLHLGELFFLCFVLRLTYILFECAVEFVAAIIIEAIRLAVTFVRIFLAGVDGAATEVSKQEARSRFWATREKQHKFTRGVLKLLRAPKQKEARSVFSTTVGRTH